MAPTPMKDAAGPPSIGRGITAQGNETLIEALAQLEAEGFDRTFIVTDDGKLRCGECRAEIPPAGFGAVQLRRIEGASDPADEAVVAGLRCPSCGSRGTVVLRFGPEAEPQHADVLRQVADDRPR
ncbi:MAG: hypothetical protein ACT4PW_06840 [Acidimicrobiia bacterium]